MQAEFFTDNPNASKHSFGTGNRKRLRRELREGFDYPTAIGTTVTWMERKTYQGEKRAYYRRGIISGYTTCTNGNPRYEIDLIWKTENKKGKIKLITKPERVRPDVSTVETGMTDVDHASLGMIHHFGYSLDQLLQTPNKTLKVNK